MDHEPWRAIRRGYRRYEGTLDVEDGVLVHRLGATRGTLDGLPIFDIVHQFFVASPQVLGPDPWDARLKVAGEHVDFFLALKERGLLCTRRADVVVYHYPELPPEYHRFRSDTAPSSCGSCGGSTVRSQSDGCSTRRTGSFTGFRVRSRRRAGGRRVSPVGSCARAASAPERLR